jgi:hypothetical protein
MTLIATCTWFMLCATAFAWNPIGTIDPSDSNALHSAGIEIQFTRWRHADSTTSHYWFHIVVDGTSLPPPTQLDATATLRRESDPNKWDVKVTGTPMGTNVNHVRLSFEVTEEFIPNSLIIIQKHKVGRGVGGYRLLLSDIVEVPSLSSLRNNQSKRERDNK